MVLPHRWFSHIGWFGDDGSPTVGTTHPDLEPIDPGAITRPGGADGVRPEIGVIDTGVDPQRPWLRNRVAGNLEQPPGTHDHGEEGAHVHDDEQHAHDEGPPLPPTAFGHGTGVCGVIRQGVPWAEIWLRRPRIVGPCNLLEEIDLILLTYDLEIEGCTVINFSFGGTTVGVTGALEGRLQQFRANTGGSIVAAAGNRESATQPLAPMYPPAWDVTRAAAGGEGTVLTDPASYDWWSNGGDWVDDLLPVDERSGTDGTDKRAIWTCFPGDAIAAWEGTSMLAPRVTAQLAGGVDPHPDRV